MKAGECCAQWQPKAREVRIRTDESVYWVRAIGHRLRFKGRGGRRSDTSKIGSFEVLPPIKDKGFGGLQSVDVHKVRCPDI
jgi:hypothetical protein